VVDRESKSLGHETTFEHDTSDLAFLEQTIRSFLGTLAHDLRVQGLAAGSFTVKLKDAKFLITTRQQQFRQPLNYDPAMWPSIRSALHSLASPHICYRLVGLSLSGLLTATESLFEQRQAQAVAALDGLIERYGNRIVRLGGIPEE
jgi:DNA polymerase-4